MILPMLAIDKNIEVSLKIQAGWLERGIDTVRVDSMQEAIDKLTKENFLFVGINADNINYLPLLRIMADMSSVPIFIVTSNFKVSDQTEAFKHGADGYTGFQKNIAEAIDSALALLHRCNERTKAPKKMPENIIYEDLIISIPYRQAFFNDIEINLSKIEFDLLHYFISNPDRSLSYTEIYLEIWGEEYQDLTHKNLWNHVFNLRQKLKKATGYGYINTERNVGYRFVSE